MNNIKSNTLSTGLAIYAMFFGAGNVVFSLTTGQEAQDMNGWATLGLMLTAVGVPFLGLMSMTLFDGDYKQFFDRLGRIPGFLITIAILGLIGPFGATPRCIALSYSTMKFYMPDVSLVLFSLISCLLIFALTIKKNKILDLLGFVLTPALMISLGIIIVMGWIYGPALPPSDHSQLSAFLKGLLEGYQTMDLLGAFFFSSVVLTCLRQDVNPADKKDYKRMIKLTMRAGVIGMGLLALTYIGLSFVSAFYSGVALNVPQDELASALSLLILGPYAGVITCVAIALTCLTTAVALAIVSADFIHIELTKGKLSYPISLVITLVLTFLVSTLNFNGIKMFLAPILEVAYPALIVLSILNILHKLYRVETVKAPVAAVFVISLLGYLFM